MKGAKSKTNHGRKEKMRSESRVRSAHPAQSSRVVSATRAARSFSELLDRVCYRGESFVIERGGELVCEMSRVKPPRFTGADFLTLVHSLPKPDPRFSNAVKKATRQKPAIPESPWES
jgi:hypothetical protein